MKRITKMFILCLATFFISQAMVQKLHAEEPDTPKVYVKVLFWVEDATGEKDSCWFIGTPTATDGIDEHLGEVNLYGVPSEKDLDIRIIQRAKNNYNY